MPGCVNLHLFQARHLCGLHNNTYMESYMNINKQLKDKNKPRVKEKICVKYMQNIQG